MDQRDFTRIRQHLIATATAHDGRSVSGETRDLALGGVFVMTGQPLPKGTRCRLRFLIAGADAQIELEGIVARVEPSGMGIRFLAIDVQAYDRLRRNANASP